MTHSAQPSRTYNQILKSSVLVGGSSAANIVIGIARAKAMAVLLGPAGVGLTGLYSSIVDITSTVAGMGVNASGVRQIAAAVASSDTEVIARTTVVLRRVSIVLGALGGALLVLFSGEVSAFTFGNARYAGAVYLLSFAVFFKLVSAGQSALIQGMRRISTLAKMSIWTALLGTSSTIAVVFVLREEGIALSLVCGAAISILISWRYSRQIRVHNRFAPATEIAHDVAGLLKLGVAFMVTSLMTMGSAYATRILLLRYAGLTAAGLYQAAWTIGSLYVGFILQAMGADFYPRLTASANDNTECNRLVNEQTFIGLLLGGPGVLATLTLAPMVLTMFYSATFRAAIDLLRWFCLGTILQVISWPIGFIALAKGRQHVFLLSDLAWSVVYIGLTWVGVREFGLRGVGIAFVGSYLFHVLVTYPIAWSLTRFSWSIDNRTLILTFSCASAIVFCGFYWLPSVWAVCIGVSLAAGLGLYAIRTLVRLSRFTRLPSPARLFLDRFKSSALRA